MVDRTEADERKTVITTSIGPGGVTSPDGCCVSGAHLALLDDEIAHAYAYCVHSSRYGEVDMGFLCNMYIG